MIKSFLDTTKPVSEKKEKVFFQTVISFIDDKDIENIYYSNKIFLSEFEARIYSGEFIDTVVKNKHNNDFLNLRDFKVGVNTLELSEIVEN